MKYKTKELLSNFIIIICLILIFFFGFLSGFSLNWFIENEKKNNIIELQFKLLDDNYKRIKQLEKGCEK